jgi:hypothetical protein
MSKHIGLACYPFAKFMALHVSILNLDHDVHQGYIQVVVFAQVL